VDADRGAEGGHDDRAGEHAVSGQGDRVAGVVAARVKMSVSVSVPVPSARSQWVKSACQHSLGRSTSKRL
jgi:hypothetical protein